MSGFIRCLKVKYTKKEAQTILNRLFKHDRRHRWKDRHRKEQRCYYCDVCNAYHLTSKDWDDYSNLPDFVDKEEFFNKLKQVMEVYE